MLTSTDFLADLTSVERVDVSRVDRWPIYRRLQELMIPCWCLEDGSLWVHVQDVSSAFLVRSTVKQIVAPRQELIHWLERCWNWTFE